MDLYEALKSGTSYDELTKTFEFELNAARDRIVAEEKAKTEAKARADDALNTIRADLAINIKDYLVALLGDEDTKELSYKDIDDTLKAFEKSISYFFETINSFVPKEETKNKNTSNESFFMSDDEIIKKFLKNMK